MKKIGILTSGGDAPGMNSAIRAVTKAAIHDGYEVYGIYNGYKGLVEGDIRRFYREDVMNILNRGGTILGSARLPEFKQLEVREKAVAHLTELGIDSLVVIGGDGSYRGAQALTEMGINCIALPGTIDNDIASSDYTIGFFTALNTAIESIDKLRDTSLSHQRCSVVEVMGRTCGDLAEYSGLATGAEMVITNETGFDVKTIYKALENVKTRKKKHAIIVITENITNAHELAIKIEAKLDIETRATVLGHVQRGGSPSAFDRVLATRMGIYAVGLLKEGIGGKAIGLKGMELENYDILDALDVQSESFKLYNMVDKLI